MKLEDVMGGAEAGIGHSVGGGLSVVLPRVWRHSLPFHMQIVGGNGMDLAIVQ